MRIPAEVFPPGEYIRDELEARGWTQADLAEVLGCSLSNVSDILNGRRGITAETAKGLSEAFGTSAEVWLNLDNRYRLSKATSTPGTELRSQIYSKVPVREVVKRGWISGSRDPEVLAQQVCEFLGLTSIEEEPKQFAHAARKTGLYSEASPAQMAWLWRVAHVAPAIHVARPYRASLFDQLVLALLTLVSAEQEVRRVPRVLSDFGIRFVIVEDLPGTKIDGACVWVDRASPVVAMTLRYGRLDSFWHTLFHELGHVKAEDGLSDGASIDTDLRFTEGELPEGELAANRFAVETLVSPNELDGFIARVGPQFSTTRIKLFGQRLRVHPAIVAGQLAYRGEIPWSRANGLIPVIRDLVTGVTLTDGWGHLLPTSP